jgi:hypothetical protein
MKMTKGDGAACTPVGGWPDWQYSPHNDLPEKSRTACDRDQYQEETAAAGDVGELGGVTASLATALRCNEALCGQQVLTFQNRARRRF